MHNIDYDLEYSKAMDKMAKGGEVKALFKMDTPTGEPSKLTYIQQLLVRTKSFKEWFGDWESFANKILDERNKKTPTYEVEISLKKKFEENDFSNGNLSKNQKLLLLYFTMFNITDVSHTIDYDTLEPQSFWHGTKSEEFYEFRTDVRNTGRPYSYFAINKEYSENFSKGKTLYSVFTCIKNPYIKFDITQGIAQAFLVDVFVDYGLKNGITGNDLKKLFEDEKYNYVKKSVFDNFPQKNNNVPFWMIMARDNDGQFKRFLQELGYDGVMYMEEFVDVPDLSNKREITRAVTIFEPNQVKLADGRNTEFSALNNDIRYAKGGEVTVKYQKDLEENLKQEGWSINYYDNYANEVPKDKAKEISLNRFDPYYQRISIKVPSKKEVTLDWVMNKVNNDVVYKSFTEKFNQLLKSQGDNINAYATTYGIGVLVGFGMNIEQTKDKVESLLDKLGISYYKEYSDAQIVLRYKISKSKDNLKIIEQLNQNKYAQGGEVALQIDSQYKKVMNDDDFYPFIIVDDNGEKLGTINLNYRNDLNGYQVSNSKVDKKGQGYGKKAYLLLIKQMDKPIISDSSLTEDAKNLWESLEKSGNAYYDKEKGKFVSINKMAQGGKTKMDRYAHLLGIENNTPKFAEGGSVQTEHGMTNNGKRGGYFEGRPHSEGGIKAWNTTTNSPIEVEGGEVIITKKAVDDDELYEFEGEMLTNKQILSKINESGGGVKFEDGGEIHQCNCSGKMFKFGGETLEDYKVLNKMNQNYSKKESMKNRKTQYGHNLMRKMREGGFV